MPPDDIEAVGTLLYGRQWLRPLARDLGVSDMTVRRWWRLECKIPISAVDDMRRLLLARRERLAEMHQSLPRAAA